jgi:hypothetical protein
MLVSNLSVATSMFVSAASHVHHAASRPRQNSYALAKPLAKLEVGNWKDGVSTVTVGAKGVESILDLQRYY